MTRLEAVDKLCDSYSAYFDVERFDEEDTELAATCFLYVHSEKYVLVKAAKLWEADSNEYVYIFSVPHLTKDTHEIDYGMGAQISDLWTTKTLKIYPGSAATFSFSEYYTEMIGGIASAGSTYEATATTLNSSVSAIDNKRQQVTGVSTDEELASMIKYQNAYNAASRYINVITTMIDTLLNMTR